MKVHLDKIFTEVADKSIWGGNDSRSGPGSNLIQTEIIRGEIVKLLETRNIKSMLDIPCGDFFWMKEIKSDLIKLLNYYIGADIVNSLVVENQNKFGNEIIRFQHINIITDKIPKVDLILTRDCFIHFSFYYIYNALNNIKSSGSEYLLVSTYTKPRINKDVIDIYIPGRAINLQQYPFKFPPPLYMINENCTEGNGEYLDKSLVLYKITDINLTNLENYLKYKRKMFIVKLKFIYLIKKLIKIKKWFQ